MIEPGVEAPDFTLLDQDGNHVTLSELRGRKVLLVFYPQDFSPVCTDQLNIYQEVLQDIEEQGAVMYGISIDHAFAHKAFQERLGVSIPLLADFEPKGAVAKRYGVYADKYGVAKRALVLIDEDGKVAWAYKSPSPLEIPGANLIFDALAT